MKAVYFYEHGKSDVLQFGELPTPQVGEEDVLIHLKAAALNRLDLWTRWGWPGLKLELPHIPGADGAGIVEEVGTGVKNLKIGDRVVINPNIGCGRCEFCLAGKDNLCRNWHLLGETLRGTYAEYVVVPERNAYVIPQSLDFETAAAGALVFQTAWHSMISRGNLRAGEIVLIVGASGGVNTASIQIAKFAGAKVIVVGSSAAKLARAKELGADEIIDRSQDENWSKQVYLITNKHGADVIVDNVGTTFMQSFRAAAKGGRILTVGNSGGAQFEIDNRLIFGKHLSVIGSTMSPQSDFRTVMGLISDGKLIPVIDRVFPLEEARQAQDYLEAGLQFGKIVLRIP
ncbi:MAG: alcohol dehydrogenase catalytic domain-containing protein [Anaerolineales bacterium]